MAKNKIKIVWNLTKMWKKIKREKSITIFHFLGGKFVKFQEKNIENFSPDLDSDFSLVAFEKLFG